MSKKEYKKRKKLLIDKGWDFVHLADLWNIDTQELNPDPNIDGSELIKEFLKEKFRIHFSECKLNDYNCKCGLKRVAKDLRIFLKTLSSYNHSYRSPLWKGLSKIKDDSELIKLSIPLIEFMWD